MAYYFMLDTFPLPIPPSALTIKTPSLNQTVTLINDGEINIPKRQGLREISFDFLIPSVQKYPFALYHLGFLNASAWILLLKYAKEYAIPFPFIVVRMSPGGTINYFTSIVVVIEDVDFKEDAEEYGLDTMCSINLKEYKPYATKRVEIKNPSGNRPGTAKVQNTRSTTGKTNKPTSKGNTSIEAAKKSGNTVSDTLNLNDIKAPSSTSDINDLLNSKLEGGASHGVDIREDLELLYNDAAAKANKSLAEDILLVPEGTSEKVYKNPVTSTSSKTLFDLIGKAISPGAIPF